jgi:diaminopropionate ammonia-lyase
MCYFLTCNVHCTAIKIRMARYFLNSAARRTPHVGLFSAGEYEQVVRFFRKVPSLPATPMHRLSGLAKKLHLKDIWAKDESSRLGVSSFKIMGVRYAVNDLLARGVLVKGQTVACATDGNHGHAVAHMARVSGLKAHVFMHSDTVPARLRAVTDEGARAVLVDGNYDDSVRFARQEAERNGWTIISDTAWPGYEAIPRQIMAGYTMIMEEAFSQCEDLIPDVVLVQAGVGGFLCAVVSWLCHRYGTSRPYVISCEPSAAACVLESARAGEPVTIRGKLRTMMAGLSAGQISSIAFPIVTGAVDAFVAIEDKWSAKAMRLLAHPCPPDPVVTAGESGACGLAALLALQNDEDLVSLLKASGLTPASRVMVINTEGATDPSNYARIVGQRGYAKSC